MFTLYRTISKPTAAECTQNILVLGSSNISLTKGSVLALFENGATSGRAIFSFEIPQNVYTMIIFTPDIDYASYDIYTGVTASADEDFYGLYLNNISCSGGSKEETITISSNLTKPGGNILIKILRNM